MIGDIAAHPDHQVLILALVEKEQIPGQGLVDLLGDEPAVLLDNAQGRGKGTPLGAAELLPVVPQPALLRSQVQFRRQIPVGEAVRSEPRGIMGFERFIDRKSDQPRAIPLPPSRGGPLPNLLSDDPHQPCAKGHGLPAIQDRGGISGHWHQAGGKPQQNYRTANASHFRDSHTACGPVGWAGILNV